MSNFWTILFVVLISVGVVVVLGTIIYALIWGKNPKDPPPPSPIPKSQSQVIFWGDSCGVEYFPNATDETSRYGVSGCIDRDSTMYLEREKDALEWAKRKDAANAKRVV